MLIQYPLIAVKGDLMTVEDNNSTDAALTKARILTDVVIGERQFYPEFGVDFHLFAPTNQNADLEAIAVANSLNFYCKETGNPYTYSVANIGVANDDKISLEVLIDV